MGLHVAAMVALAWAFTGRTSAWSIQAPRYSTTTQLHSTPPSSNTGAQRLLSCESLTKSYDGTRYQFRDISLSITAGSRTGLIGINGVGKSTLMKILAGQEASDSGIVSTTEGGKRPVVLYVEQEPAMSSGSGEEWTVADALTESMVVGPSADTPEAKRTRAALLAVRSYWAASDDNDPSSLAVSLMTDTEGAWELETRLAQLASSLDVFSPSFRHKSISSLSGGQRKRVALASALAQDADILLLDEPTNHLDWEAIDWLADHLQEQGKRQRSSAQTTQSLLVVTHDRYFLERTCRDVLELDSTAVYRYKIDGSYDMYLRRRAERIVAQDAELARQAETLKREGAWDAKSPRARQAKSKSRSAAYQQLKESNALTMGERAVTRATAGGGADLWAAAKEAAGGSGGLERRLGGKVMELEGARIKVTKRPGLEDAPPSSNANNTILLLDGLSYTFERGERIIIVGRNGVGKTSFLRALVDEHPLTDGRRIVGETVRFGYYDQRGLRTHAENERQNILDYVVSQVELGVDDDDDTTTTAGASKFKSISADVARRLLTKFAFPPSRHRDLVSKLSGGEKRRLQLLACLASRPNVLILDEPTNDLDIATLEVLEEYLDSFSGVLLVVSHDRWFCDKIMAPKPKDGENGVEEEDYIRRSSMFVFEGEGVVSQFQGTYSEYFKTLEKAENGGVAIKPGFTECITGYDSPPPLPVKVVAPVTTPSETVVDGVHNTVDRTMAVRSTVTKTASPLKPVPKPIPKPAQAVVPKINTVPAPSQRSLERLGNTMLEQQKAAKKKNKKIKVTKKERMEYATIESEVEELEIAAAKAQAAVDSMARSLSMNDQLKLVSECDNARRAADQKMERYIVLDELITAADESI